MSWATKVVRVLTVGDLGGRAVTYETDLVLVYEHSSDRISVVA